MMNACKHSDGTIMRTNLDCSLINYLVWHRIVLQSNSTFKGSTNEEQLPLETVATLLKVK